MIKESDAIEVLNLNTGTLNRLKNNGVFFIKDLLNLKYQDSLNYGKKSRQRN